MLIIIIWSTSKSFKYWSSLFLLIWRRVTLYATFIKVNSYALLAYMKDHSFILCQLQLKNLALVDVYQTYYLLHCRAVNTCCYEYMLLAIRVLYTGVSLRGYMKWYTLTLEQNYLFTLEMENIYISISISQNTVTLMMYRILWIYIN